MNQYYTVFDQTDPDSMTVGFAPSVNSAKEPLETGGFPELNGTQVIFEHMWFFGIYKFFRDDLGWDTRDIFVQLGNLQLSLFGKDSVFWGRISK